MGIGPGNIANLIPPRADDQQRKARDLARTQREQASAKTGQAMQIGDGGILIDGTGGLTIAGTGQLNVGSGALNSSGSITAATTITAGGDVQGGGLISTGDASVTGALSTGSVSTGGVTATGNVISGGQVQSNGAPLLSQPSFNYLVVTNYKSAWIDGGSYQIGYSPSAEIVKTSLQQMTADDARKLLNLTPYWGHYVWDAPTDPLKVFFLAADVQTAGFGPDVAPVVEGEPLVMQDANGPIMVNGQPATVPVGEAYSVNYSQIVVPLVAAYHDGAAAIQALTDRVTTLEARLAAAGIA